MQLRDAAGGEKKENPDGKKITEHFAGKIRSIFPLSGLWNVLLILSSNPLISLVNARMIPSQRERLCDRILLIIFSEKAIKGNNGSRRQKKRQKKRNAVGAAAASTSQLSDQQHSPSGRSCPQRQPLGSSGDQHESDPPTATHCGFVYLLYFFFLEPFCVVSVAWIGIVLRCRAADGPFQQSSSCFIITAVSERRCCSSSSFTSLFSSPAGSFPRSTSGARHR